MKEIEISQYQHLPVMLNEVIDLLKIKKNGIYVDCTLGGAGHSSEILKFSAVTGGFQPARLFALIVGDHISPIGFYL